MWGIIVWYVVCHEYDVGGFSHPTLEWLSDEGIHGCYTVLVSRSGFECGGGYKAPEHLGCQWLFDIFEVFMHGGLGQMCLCDPGA